MSHCDGFGMVLTIYYAGTDNARILLGRSRAFARVNHRIEVVVAISSVKVEELTIFQMSPCHGVLHLLLAFANSRSEPR